MPWWENTFPEHRRGLQGEEASTQDEKPGGETSVPGPVKVAAVLSFQPSGLFLAGMWANLALNASWWPGPSVRFCYKMVSSHFPERWEDMSGEILCLFEFNVRCCKWIRHFRIPFTMTQITSVCPSDLLFPSCVFWMSQLCHFNAGRTKSVLPVLVPWFCPICTWIFIPIVCLQEKIQAITSLGQLTSLTNFRVILL